MSNPSEFIVVLSDGETFSSLKGAAIYKLKDDERDEDTVEAMLRTSADKKAATPDDEEGNVEQVWLGREVVSALCPPPKKEVQEFFNILPRDGTPRAGQVLRNGAVVLAVKVLPLKDGCVPCSIVLCRFHNGFWTWLYDEQRDACYYGHEHNKDQLQEAFADWCQRT